MTPINKAVLEELVCARKIAQDYAAAFGDAIKHQAEIHRLKPAALRAYVCAMADDRVEDLAALADQLTALIDEDQPDLFSGLDERAPEGWSEEKTIEEEAIK